MKSLIILLFFSLSITAQREFPFDSIVRAYDQRNDALDPNTPSSLVYSTSVKQWTITGYVNPTADYCQDKTIIYYYNGIRITLRISEDNKGSQTPLYRQLIQSDASHGVRISFKQSDITIDRYHDKHTDKTGVMLCIKLLTVDPLY